MRTYLLTLLLSVILVAPASAVPVQWFVDGVFEDGGSLTGTFVYDADIAVFGQYSGVNLMTTAAGMFPGEIYLDESPGFLSGPNVSAFVTDASLPDLTGTPALGLTVLVPLTNAGGTIDLFPHDTIEAVCNNPTCFSAVAPVRRLESGTVSTIPPAVPEPATWTLIGLGALALVARRRR